MKSSQISGNNVILFPGFSVIMETASLELQVLFKVLISFNYNFSDTSNSIKHICLY